MVLTYDPTNLFVEVLPDRSLVLTPLESGRVIPLVRYRTGDKAEALRLPAGESRRLQRAAGLQSDILAEVPVLLVHGRGEGVRCGDALVTPEHIKEGIYVDMSLAALTTGNFRLTGLPAAAHVRVQLRPGVANDPDLSGRFAQAIAPYAPARVEVTCSPHLEFAEGIATDYERKFAYLGEMQK